MMDDDVLMRKFGDSYSMGNVVVQFCQGKCRRDPRSIQYFYKHGKAAT